MAFCPNCGTPNTEQAEKCVACGFELAVPKQKAKFKGTIMMSGIKAPTVPQRPGAEPGPPPAQPAAPPPSAPQAAPGAHPSQPQEGGKNLAFQKTMLGHAPLAPPAAPPARTPEPGGRAPTDFSQAATVQGPAAQFTPPRTPAARPDLADTTPGRPTSSGALGASAAEGGSGSEGGGFSGSGASAGGFGGGAGTGGFGGSGAGTGSFGGDAGTGSFGGSGAGTGSFGGGAGAGSFGGTPTRSSFGGAPVDSTFPPSAAKPNPGKVLALGCAAVLLLSCAIGGILYFVLADKLKALLAEGGDGGAEAAAWQASIAQSLAQVSALCQVDCAQASVFFHPRVQETLLGEAKALTPARLQKLSDTTQTKAAMLDGTDDQALATGLGLDPQQCARVMVGAAKVVSCSVPDPGGKPSVLRIVHLGGISSL